MAAEPVIVVAILRIKTKRHQVILVCYSSMEVSLSKHKKLASSPATDFGVNLHIFYRVATLSNILKTV